MADDDNGIPIMHYIDYEDIIGVELIKNLIGYDTEYN